MTTGDEFTQAVNDATAAVAEVNRMETMGDVVQGLVDGTANVVRALLEGLKSDSGWLPGTPKERPLVDAEIKSERGPAPKSNDITAT